GSAIAVEVGSARGVRIDAETVVHVRLEGAVAVAEQNRNGSWRTRQVITKSIRNDEIQIAVAVKIPSAQEKRQLPHRVNELGLESAIAIAKQDRDGIAARVGDSNIRFSIVVEVSDNDRIGTTADGVRDGRLKRAVAVAHQDGYGIRV